MLLKDNGPGIPSDDLPYIFERFYRADKSRNRLTGASGIGLTITKAIVEAHKGKIEVISNLDAGTEFIFYFPDDAYNDQLQIPVNVEGGSANTLEESMDTEKVKTGDLVKLTYENNSEVDHPMHLHGHFFHLRSIIPDRWFFNIVLAKRSLL